jgi:hypothetical protein
VNRSSKATIESPITDPATGPAILAAEFLPLALVFPIGVAASEDELEALWAIVGDLKLNNQYSRILFRNVVEKLKSFR